MYSTVAKGTLKPESSGLVSGLAAQAGSLNLGNGEDDKPTIIVEFDTGLELIITIILRILASLVLLLFFAGIF